MSVNKSNCEFKYYVLKEAEKEKMWLYLLFQELDHIFTIPMIILANNQDAIALAKNPEF